MISIRDLRFSYSSGEFCLAVDELRVKAGEAVAVIGASGTGKTTLLNLVSGVTVPGRGSVTTHDTCVSELEDAARRAFRIRHIGMIFQEFELLEYLNVRDNILLPYRISPALRLDRETTARAARLAGMVGIADKLRRPVRRLSQGERQRVAICRALVTEPPLLLADEPTGNLDPENTARVLDILFEHVRQSTTTLVSVTHERDQLDRFDRVVDFDAFRTAEAHA
jgi:putative ABC transport system ATP-binding protein